MSRDRTGTRFLLGGCALIAALLLIPVTGEAAPKGKTTICHNGKTISTGNPGGPPHYKHPGSHAGPCTTVVTPPPVTPGPGLPGTPGAAGSLGGATLTADLAELGLTGVDPEHVGCLKGADQGELEPPETGDTINARWVSGEPIRFETPSGEHFCMGRGSVQIPVTSKIDARDSKVEVETEGSVRKANFYDGFFQVLQGDEEHAATVLKLLGPFQGCEDASAEKPGGRQLWGEGEGLHRTEGRLAAATVRGTKWMVQDRCNGTTFAKVVEGLVTLHDKANDKDVELEAGESYVAGP